MSKQNVIRGLVQLPHGFRRLRSVSMYSLLVQSGYFQIYKEITYGDIAQVLNEDPDAIKDWLQFSEDQRTEAGWYFSKSENGEFSLGFHPDPSNDKSQTFTDAATACAVFIKHHIEDLRVNAG